MIITVDGKQFDVKDSIVEILKAGKWDATIKEIMKTYKLNESDARKIGVSLKNEIGKENQIIQEKLQEMKDNLLVTSGYNFEGYRIIQYLGVINKESVLGSGIASEFIGDLSDLVGGESNVFSEKIQKARSNAYTKLVSETIRIGGNAIIGMDYEYFTLKANMICVCAKGTAVNVEKVFGQ